MIDVDMGLPQRSLGQKLRELREQRGLTQDQLAERVGVWQSAISAFESGATTPRVTTLRRIALCLDISTSVLIEALEPEEQPA